MQPAASAIHDEHVIASLSRIILWVDVVDTPRPGGVDLHDGIFVKEDRVRHARRKCEEAADGQRLSLAVIRSLSHSQTDRPRDHSVDFWPGMRMRRNVITLRRLEPHGKYAFLARVAVQHS